MRHPKIFVVNGTGGSGKDTFVGFVQDIWPRLDNSCHDLEVYGFHSTEIIKNLSTIDQIKEVARYFGYTGAKTEKDRLFLSQMKAICKDYNDGPYQHMMKLLRSYISRSWTRVIFIHTREVEEIKRFVEDTGARTILVRNPRVADITSNPSDAQVGNYEYDIVIENDGTIQDLREKARQFVKNELSESQI